MKTFRISIVCLCIVNAVFGADRTFKPAVVDAEPSEAIYPKESRCEEPKVFQAPKVVYPWELGSGIAGAVDVCVKVDASGYPSRISVLRSTQHVFERYAIANAIQTTWLVEPRDKRTLDGWFVRQIVFVQRDEPNQSLEPTPTAGTSAAEQPLVPAAVVAHL